MFKDTRPLIATGSWGPKYPCELFFFHPTAAEGPQRPSDIEAGARELHYCGLGTCWTQGPGPHQSSPCPATSSGYNERKERDLGGKQEPEIPSARSGPGRAAWRWQAMANVRRSCHRTLTVVGSPGLPTLALWCRRHTLATSKKGLPWRHPSLPFWPNNPTKLAPTGRSQTSGVEKLIQWTEVAGWVGKSLSSEKCIGEKIVQAASCSGPCCCPSCVTHSQDPFPAFYVYNHCFPNVYAHCKVRLSPALGRF